MRLRHSHQCSLLAVSLLLLPIVAPAVHAHDQSGSFTSGAAATVDYYQVTCSDDGNGTPGHLVFRIKDLTPNASRVSVTVGKGATCSPKACARSTTDRNDTDAAYSLPATVAQGAGVYLVFVSHTGPGVERYSLGYHCETVDNVHTGTTITPRQQQ